MRLIYNIVIRFYILYIWISSFFNSKAKLWLIGRKNILRKIKHATKNEKDIVWFHCASLGEFEQGRPIIDGYKQKYPEHKIFLTFFSPSAYEVSRHYKNADWIFYLPADTTKNAKQFITTLKPIKVIFIKYDFWFNYMFELKSKNIPLYFVSSIFRETQSFFKCKWFAKQLNNVTHFFIQDTNSQKLLNKIGIKQVSVSGDSRFDRVRENSKNPRNIPLIDNFTNTRKTLIAGSTWPKDEKFLKQFIKVNHQYNYIIAPHKIEQCNILAKQINGLLYSKATTKNINKSNVLIIDRIGLLSSIYQHGTFSYIGGGFGTGIHNILEPAAFDVPIVFGPHYQKFNEAKELIELGGAISITDTNELSTAINHFSENYKPETCRNYIESRCGSTKKILEII